MDKNDASLNIDICFEYFHLSWVYLLHTEYLLQVYETVVVVDYFRLADETGCRRVTRPHVL